MHSLHSPRSPQVLRLKGPKSERPLGVERRDCPLRTPPFFSGSKISLYWGREERKGRGSLHFVCEGRCYLGFSLCFPELALTAVISQRSWLPSFPQWALLCGRWVRGGFLWCGVRGMHTSGPQQALPHIPLRRELPVLTQPLPSRSPPPSVGK